MIMDIEQGPTPQTCNKAEVETSSSEEGKKSEKLILLLFFVFSVAVDPLFFYLPVINEERKCVVLDRKLYITSMCLRTVLDSISLVYIILQYLRPPEQNGDLAFKDIDCSLVIEEVLAILPIPQVLLPIMYSKMKGSQSLTERKLMTIVVLFQYLPRALRIYRSWKEVFKDGNEGTCLSEWGITVKALISFLPYIVASHVLGGIWYFFSIERETACWHLACENHVECDRQNYFDCNHGFGNHKFLNGSCPIETQNTTVFDFGIFQGALQSGIVASMDFPQKILYCFWWGLRNLSSFGSNLQTSPYFWENGFAVITSIFGLISFLYFLGHMQLYMQWEVNTQLDKAKKCEVPREKQLDEAKKCEVPREKQLDEAKKFDKGQFDEAKKFEEKEQWEASRQFDKAKKFDEKKQRPIYDVKTKIRKIHEWIDRNQRLREKRKLIIAGVTRTFEQNKDIDAENPLPHLPIFTRIEILHHLCAPLLQKVPLLQDASEDMLKLISSDFIKPVSYNENSYIAREGEPLDALLFITQGIVWTYTTRPDHDRQTGCLKTNDFYGVELLDWVFNFNSPSLPDQSKIPPFSTRTLRCHTKVQALALTAVNIQRMLCVVHWRKYRKLRRVSGTDFNPEQIKQLQSFAASKIQAAFLRMQNARLSILDASVDASV